MLYSVINFIILTSFSLYNQFTHRIARLDTPIDFQFGKRLAGSHREPVIDRSWFRLFDALGTPIGVSKLYRSLRDVQFLS